MKLFRTILIWMMISLTIQFAGLFYVNNYFLTSNTSIKMKKIVKSDVKKPEPAINVPENAKDVSVSFDARYLAYYDGDTLKVIDTKTGDEKQVEFNSGIKVSFYKWLPDRNRMLIAEKETSNSSSNFKLAYYDVDKAVKEEIRTLDWANKKAEVKDIQASPLTNVIYVKVDIGGGRSSIYWINIMKEMKKVDTRAYIIGTIRVIPHEDTLLYEDLIYHRVYATGQYRPINVKGVNNPSLLDVDDNDNVYIGETQDDKISKIYYGDIKDPENKFQVIDLKGSVKKSDIFITAQGKIYINDNLKGTVKEFESGKEYTYPGTFLQIYSDGITSISDGKLVKTKFN
jgi:hypothetical protein